MTGAKWNNRTITTNAKTNQSDYNVMLYFAFECIAQNIWVYSAAQHVNALLEKLFISLHINRVARQYYIVLN